MADFDFIKFVTNSNSTLASRIEAKRKRLLKEAVEDEDDSEEEEDDAEDTWNKEDEFASTDDEKEPGSADVKAGDKDITGEYEKRQKLDRLVKQKNELVKKLKDGQITIDQYKQMIGTIPQQIKTLTADLAAAATDGEEEDEVQEALVGERVSWKDFFEKYDHTDLNGPSTEMTVDGIIEEARRLISKQIPEEDQYAARIAIKKLWAEKLNMWKG